MRRTILWLIFGLLVIVSLLSVILPFLWISPFRPQTADALRNGYEVRHAAPFITLVCFLFVAVLAFLLWERVRWLGRIFASILLTLTLVAAWFARQDYFEWFFHPLLHPGYVAAQKVNFLNDSDMVLAIRIKNDAVAYPVRLLAYHHVVNDAVGGIPVVATY